MKKLMIAIAFVVMCVNGSSQLYTWRPTVEDKWVLHHRNDTVIFEPIFVGVGSEVAINCTPGKNGLCFTVFDTEQDCIDYIQDNSLKMSEYSIAYNSDGMNYGKGLSVTNKTIRPITLTVIKTGETNKVYVLASGHAIRSNIEANKINVTL